MRKRFIASLIFLTLLTATAGEGQVAWAQTERRIAAVRELSQRVDKQIAASEETPEASTTFLMQLEVNKNLSPYPAVGIYKTVVRFYYSFGDREKNPYPDRLLKVVLTTDRSDRKELSEFLFDEAGQLVFYFENKDNVERRIYFNNETAIRVQVGTNLEGLPNRRQTLFVSKVLSEKRRLTALFRNSLDF